MLRLSLLLLLLAPVMLCAQRSSSSIEFSYTSRYDKHAEYNTRFGDRSYTDPTKLWGKSTAFDLRYAQPFLKNLKAKIGIGYYKLRVDKIWQYSTPFNLNTNARAIDYMDPRGYYILYGTRKYHYENINLNAGIVYQKKLLSTWYATGGGDLYFLYTFKQQYSIPYRDSTFPYNKENKRWLGHGINAHIGILKELARGRLYINPRLLIPVFQQLNGDERFGEDESVKMKKWFNGSGWSVSAGWYFRKRY